MKIRRLPVIDEITVDGETVVLLSRDALALSVPASTALSLITTDWIEVRDWFGRVESLLGPAPEGEAARDDLVASLVDAGIVEVTDD